MLKKFTGFKGLCAFAEIGHVQFALVAKNRRDLDTLWNHIMPEAGPLDPAGTKKAILIEAELLSERGHSCPPKPISTNAPIDV